MKNTKNVAFKIIAAVVALVLIGGMIFITNSFVGNPISAMMANKAIKQYVNQNYYLLDLEIGKTSYNFKYGAYMARAESKTSIDTRFAIIYGNGRVLRDDYETYVLGMFNTLQRLSGEYSIIAKDILDKKLGYEDTSTTVMYNKDEYENLNDILELDMNFDKELPIDAEIIIGLNMVDTSLEGISKILTDAHRAFVDNDCNFNKYNLYAENDGILVMVNGVTPRDIESGELANLLEKARDNPSGSGIYVFSKGENK